MLASNFVRLACLIRDKTTYKVENDKEFNVLSFWHNIHFARHDASRSRQALLQNTSLARAAAQSQIQFVSQNLCSVNTQVVCNLE